MIDAKCLEIGTEVGGKQIEGGNFTLVMKTAIVN